MPDVDEIKSQVMEQASQAARATKGIVANKVDDSMKAAGDSVQQHANNLQSYSETLRSQGQNETAKYIDMAAARLNDISTYLKTSNMDSSLHDLEQIARQQPGVTAAIGFAAGLLAARLIRSNARQRYESYGYATEY